MQAKYPDKPVRIVPYGVVAMNIKKEIEFLYTKIR